MCFKAVIASHKIIRGGHPNVGAISVPTTKHNTNQLVVIVI
jgi:hypothetical protein